MILEPKHKKLLKPVTIEKETVKKKYQVPYVQTKGFWILLRVILNWWHSPFKYGTVWIRSKYTM